MQSPVCWEAHHIHPMARHWRLFKLFFSWQIDTVWMRQSGSSLLWQYLEGWCARLSSMNMQPHLKHTNKIDGIWFDIWCNVPSGSEFATFGNVGASPQVVKIWDICHHLQVRSRANKRIRCPGAAGPSESTPRRTLQTVGFSDEIIFDSRIFQSLPGNHMAKQVWLRTFWGRSMPWKNHEWTTMNH